MICRNLLRVLLVAATCAAVLSDPIPLALAKSEAMSPALAVGMQVADDGSVEPAALPLSRVVYEIEVYGGMAVGTLVQEFANDTETERTVNWGALPGGGLELTLLDQDDDGRVRSLEFELREPEGRKGRVAQPRAFLSEPIELAAERPAVIRTGLRMPLELEGRHFTLRLPAVRDLHAVTRQPSGGSEEPVAATARIIVTVHREEPLLLARSGTHDILVDYVGDRTIIETTRSEVPIDRPFELEFAVNSEDAPTVAGFLRGETDGRRAVEAVLLPPEQPVETSVRPKQLTFVVDTSGSMAHEEKIAQARRAVASCFEKLGPDDRFNIIEFDTDFSMMRPEPAGPSEVGKEAVDRWIAQWRADGGTKLLPALEAALKQPEDPQRHRMIVVVTDGIICDEREALRLLDEQLGDRRLFVVGTGKQHRQETLLRLAEQGRGAATFAGDADSLETAVTELFAAISQPLGWDVEIDLAGVEVDEISPARLPDLYAGRPVRVLAWYRGDDPTGMRLRMSTVNGAQVYDVKLPPRLP